MFVTSEKVTKTNIQRRVTMSLSVFSAYLNFVTSSWVTKAIGKLLYQRRSWLISTEDSVWMLCSRRVMEKLISGGKKVLRGWSEEIKWWCAQNPSDRGYEVEIVVIHFTFEQTPRDNLLIDLCWILIMPEPELCALCLWCSTAKSSLSYNVF